MSAQGGRDSKSLCDSKFIARSKCTISRSIFSKTGSVLGELIFARTHAGPVFALAQIQETIFKRYCFPQICQILVRQEKGT